MKNTKIVHLGAVRDALAVLEKLRAAVIAGEITAFHAALQHANGDETVYLGGVYRNDPEAALKSALRASAVRALMEDDPPPIRAVM